MRLVKEQAKIPLYYILFCTTASLLFFYLCIYFFYFGGQIDIHSIIADGPSLPGYLTVGTPEGLSESFAIDRLNYPTPRLNMNIKTREGSWASETYYQRVMRTECGSGTARSEIRSRLQLEYQMVSDKD
ncbi:hypothetical protein BDV09DRAFT_17558 [Aspergillus tetrazonus]